MSNAVTLCIYVLSFFFSSRRRHTRSKRDWSSDVCSSDLGMTRTSSGFLWVSVAAMRAPVAHWARFIALGVRGMEIGRASCRERVEHARAAGELKNDVLEPAGAADAFGRRSVRRSRVRVDA